MHGWPQKWATGGRMPETPTSLPPRLLGALLKLQSERLGLA